MKKTTLMAVALATCLGYVPADAAEVVSSNVVGYQKITLQPGYNAISAQFVPVGGNSIDDLLDVSDSSALPGIDPDSETGYGFARLQTWTPGRGYTKYEWSGEGLAAAWDWSGIDNKWMTEGAADVAEIEISKGQGFWLWLDPEEVASSVSIKVFGEVPTDDSVTVPLSVGYNLIANPFPQAIDIQNIGFSNLPSMDPDTETGYGFARLQTWTPGRGYTKYEWSGEGLAAAWDWPGIDNKWMTEGAAEVAENVIIESGASFWLWIDPNTPNLSQNISATFTNPSKASN